MTEDEKSKINYRFSGYPPPLISLGGNTDAGYWCKFYTHPYYVNQPACWKQPTYKFHHHGKVLNGSGPSSDKNGDPLYSLLPVCPK